MKNSPVIGIALGGGGARGFAHLGVLKVLESAGIKPDIVVGTSMGAVIGALYAQHSSALAVHEYLKETFASPDSKALDLNVYNENQKGDHFFDHVTEEIKQRIIINLSISKKSLLAAERLENAVSGLIKEQEITDLPIRFAALASDLRTGKGIVIHEGSLQKAVIASSSIPGFFPPIEWGPYLLVDGENNELVPITACQMLGAEFVIAVDVRRDLQPMPELRHAIDIFVRSARIMGHQSTEKVLTQANHVFKPITEDVQWSEFDRVDEVIRAGEWEARAKLSACKKKISEFNPAHHKVKKAIETSLFELASFGG